MITKGNDIAGEVAYLSGSPPGDALGFPFEVGVARPIKRIALTLRATQLVVPRLEAVLPVYHSQLPQQESEWDKHIPSSSQPAAHTRAHGLHLLIRIMMRPVR
jgi:hypothetical protein